ncbi:hypothetical protein [Streptomyces sp. NPDC002666]
MNVPTDQAIAFLVREGVSEHNAREAIHYWHRIGRIINHGGSKRGEARWNLGELQRATWPRK